MRHHICYVHVVASPSPTIDTEVTNALERRMWRQEHETFRGFTVDHAMTRLV